MVNWCIISKIRKKCVPKKCSISYDFEVQKYDNSFIKTCNNCIRVQEHLNKIDSLKQRLDLIKFKIKCEEKNLKCVKQMFQKQVKIVVKRTHYKKEVNNIELINKLISPKIILFRCDEENDRKQK